MSLLLVRLTVSFRINRSEIIPCHLDKRDIDRLINQAGAESAGIAIAVLASPGRETRTICKQKTGLHVSNKSRSIYTFTVIKIDQSTRVANKTLAQTKICFSPTTSSYLASCLLTILICGVHFLFFPAVPTFHKADRRPRLNFSRRLQWVAGYGRKNRTSFAEHNGPVWAALCMYAKSVLF